MSLSGRELAWHEEAVCLLIGIAKKTKEMKGKEDRAFDILPSALRLFCERMPNSKDWTSGPLSLPSPAFSFLKIHFCSDFIMCVKSPGAGFTGGYVLPDVGAGNLIQALLKSSMCP